MPVVLYIALGGKLGAICRSFITNVFIFNTDTIIPVGTLVVNLLGSFGLAFLISVCSGAINLEESIKLGLSTGFFGSFTTFSTISLEAVYLLKDYGPLWWVTYEFINIGLGLSAAYSGYLLAEKINYYAKKDKSLSA